MDRRAPDQSRAGWRVLRPYPAALAHHALSADGSYEGSAANPLLSSHTAGPLHAPAARSLEKTPRSPAPV